MGSYEKSYFYMCLLSRDPSKEAIINSMTTAQYRILCDVIEDLMNKLEEANNDGKE